MKSKLINSEKVTFVLTSCGRTDLLDPTLESFFSKNNYPLHEMYLVEDSVDEKVYKHVKEKWGKKLNIICNKKKKARFSLSSIHINLLKHHTYFIVKMIGYT